MSYDPAYDTMEDAFGNERAFGNESAFGNERAFGNESAFGNERAFGNSMESDEMPLEELQQHTEATQLDMLTHESEHILEHGIQPTQEWYEARFFKIYQYSELNWNNFAHRYKLDNTYLADKASHIQRALQHLVEEWSTTPIFDLSVYYGVLHDMNELWKYYESEYMDENQDEDVSELISGLKHL